MSGIGTTSDSALLVSVARHDQQALAELYQRHSGSLFHVALRVLCVRGLAEDVVQDVFARLWQAPERFDPARGSLRSFLLAQGLLPAALDEHGDDTFHGDGVGTRRGAEPVRCPSRR